MNNLLGTLDAVIANLQLILANKEILSIKDDVCKERFVVIPGLRDNYGGITFSLRAGLCRNANLWSLDALGYQIPTIKGNETVSLNLHLADKFVHTYYDSDHLARKRPQYSYLSYPICDDEHRGKWLNPVRWDYVQFCLDELTHLRETGEIK